MTLCVLERARLTREKIRRIWRLIDGQLTFPCFQLPHSLSCWLSPSNFTSTSPFFPLYLVQATWLISEYGNQGTADNN